jgi:assimilatory nitrate reductase catalytic subunit
VGTLVNPVVDAVSGEPEFKHTPARVEPLRVDWYGVLFARERAADPDTTWWTRVRGQGFVRYEMADREVAPARHLSRHDWARRVLPAVERHADYIDYEDTASGIYRCALLIDSRLVACLYQSRSPQLPSRSWLASLFVKERLDDTDRRALLAGRPLDAAADAGPLVCSCFRVGRHAISAAIVRHKLQTPTQVGAHLRAGTNCGSCLPEIRLLLATQGITNS